MEVIEWRLLNGQFYFLIMADVFVQD